MSKGENIVSLERRLQEMAVRQGASFAKLDARLAAFRVLAFAVEQMREMDMSPKDIAAILRLSADEVAAEDV
jgi:hypothetical protein